MKVLVIDDTESIRIVVEELLLFLGHRVCSVASGKEALDILEGFGPDIVVTDRRMPRMSGEELIRQIKQGKPNLPVILMTGDDLSSAERNVIAATGADGILNKPFSEEDLTKALDHAVIISPA